MVAQTNISHVYRHPAETVIKTHLNKYPTKKERNVICIKEVESRYSDGIQYSRRIATVVNVLPSLLQKLLFLDQPYIYLEEECWEDRRKRWLQTKSKNLTFSEFALVTETSNFNPDPLNPQWTRFEQESSIRVSGLGYAGYLLEVFGRNFVQNGVWKSVRIMEELMQEPQFFD